MKYEDVGSTEDEISFKLPLRYTIPLILMGKKHVWTLGTGIKIKLQSKNYILTASHLIDDFLKYKEYGKIVTTLLPDQIVDFVDLKIIEYYKHPTADVACIEVDHEWTEYVCEEFYIKWDNVSPKKELSYFLYGFPLSESSVKNTSIPWYKIYEVWGVAIRTEHRHDDNNDEVKFKIDDENVFYFGNTVSLDFTGDRLKKYCTWGCEFGKNPNPYGFSGGGIWILNKCENLWTPSKTVKLIGVQSYYTAYNRCITAFLLDHDWLMMIS